MGICTVHFRWQYIVTTLMATCAAILALSATASAVVRVTGIDVSYWQGDLSQDDWDTIHDDDGKSFVFIRSSRGGTTGYYDQNNSDNDPPTNTLSMRYDDPTFVSNITKATNAGLFAGPYHYGRMDVIASTPWAEGIANNGTDEANHFIQMAGAWMRPGYLLPVFDFEAGQAQRTPSELAQFAVDFSNRIFEVKGIRPMVYIGNNYSSPMDSIPESAALVAAYPGLWNPRWPNQGNPDAIDIQNTNPGDSLTSIYGPWDNPPNTDPNPWHFWQYASTGRLQGIDNGNSNVDLDVAHGGIEYLKDHLVPAMWRGAGSGDWTSLSNWNSGETPTPPQTGAGQVPPTDNSLPTPRLPDADDTVILDKPGANITVTLNSGENFIRKLYVAETLKIENAGLDIGYVPSPDSTPISAEFNGPVSISGTSSLSAHTIQVDASRTLTLGGGFIAFSALNLMPNPSFPAHIELTGDIALSPLVDSGTATITKGAGAGNAGIINMEGGNRSIFVDDGSNSIDVSINVPLANGALTKAGPGTLALNSLNTYTGDTVVQQGKLRLGTPSLSDTGSVYLSNGTTLDLHYSGATDYVHGFFINGVQQAYGVWGAPGSGAQFTTPFITGNGRLNVVLVPPPPPPPGHVIDDFEADEGHFSWSFQQSTGPTNTFGLVNGTTIDRVTTQHQGPTGEGSQLLNLVASGSWQLRHMSGAGTGNAGEPAGNEPLEATGYVGFWLKTDHAGMTVRLAIDDPVSGNSAVERSFAQNIFSDNQWHLYQWNLTDANHWDALSGGADGDIDAPTGLVTINSIWFAGSGNAQIYLDNVSHNALGKLSASAVAGDFNGDGIVNSADYILWRTSLGDAVAPGTKADSNASGLVDTADYVTWRKLASPNGASSLEDAAAVPEPCGVLLALAGPALVLSCSNRLRCQR
jgi:autotransporter-associated beta strand protein